MALSREEILARKISGKTAQVPVGDGFVVVRGLTRNEALRVRDAKEHGTTADADNLVIALGLVEPVMSVEDVAAWGDDDEAGVLADVSNKISEMSGMTEGAGKSRVSGTRRGRRS